MKGKLATRFVELEQQLDAVGATHHITHSEMLGCSENVDSEALSEWKVKAKNLLVKACGPESEHFKEFTKAETPVGFDTSFSIYKRVRSVFRAAKEDFEAWFAFGFVEFSIYGMLFALLYRADAQPCCGQPDPAHKAAQGRLP